MTAPHDPTGAGREKAARDFARKARAVHTHRGPKDGSEWAEKVAAWRIAYGAFIEAWEAAEAPAEAAP